MNETEEFKTEDVRSLNHPSRFGRIAIMTVVVLAFTILMSSNWRASIAAIESLDAYHLRENSTAEKRQGTNLYSAAAYIGIGMFGLSVLAIPYLSSRRKWGALFYLLLAYWSWCGLSTLWADEPGVAIKKFMILAFLIVGVIGITGFLRLKEIIWVVVAATTTLIFLGLIAELSLGTFKPHVSEYRFCGLVHTNTQSFYGAILCIAAFCLSPDNHRWRSIRWIFLAVGIGCIVLTKSRSAMAGLVLCSFVGLFISARSWWKGILIGSTGSIACLATLLLAVLSISTSRSAFGVVAMGRGEHTESLTGRVPLWNELLLAIDGRPLLGHGFGSFWNSQRVTYYSELFSWEIPSGHSIYIDSLLETGAVGFFLFISTLVTALIVSVMRYNESKSWTNLFPIMIVTFAFIHGFTESQFVQAGFGGLWLMTCLVMLSSQEVFEVVDEKLVRASFPRNPK